MNRKELEKYCLELERRKFESSLYLFIKKFWHVIEPSTPFVDGWHIRTICEHLEAIYDGRIRKLIINIPPRNMKSILCNVMFPAWVWAKNPGKRFLHATHTDNLSIRDSLKCRRLIESSSYKQYWNSWTLMPDQNAKGRYDNTVMGSRVSLSIGAAATGEGGDIRVIDDPHKANEIHSKTIREGVTNWYDQEFSTRVTNPKTSATILIMQRLHEKDLTGHLLSKGDWDHLCLPGISDGVPRRTALGDYDKRQKGQLLWNSQFGNDEIEQLKKDLGAFGFAGQIQQTPVSEEGGILKRNWMHLYDELPEITDIIQSWDLNFDEGETNDYVVGTVWGRCGIKKYLLDLIRAKIGFEETVKAIKVMCSRHPNTSQILIEKKANGAAVMDVLKKQIPHIIGIEPKESKESRVHSVTLDFESGDILLPRYAPWVDDYIKELCVFPKGEHDDQVDSTTQAIIRMKKTAKGEYRAHVPNKEVFPKQPQSIEEKISLLNKRSRKESYFE